METVRDWLYIGNLRDTQNIQGLNASGVDAMLQLAEAVPQTNIAHLFLPVEDGDALTDRVLRVGLAFIAAQRQQNKRVLIACAAGVSRSATFTVAALKEGETISLTEALRSVVAAHPETLPHPVFWKSLCDFYSEPFSLTEMVRICRPESRI